MCNYKLYTPTEFWLRDDFSTWLNVLFFADPVKLPFQMLATPLHFYRDPSQIPPWLAEAGKKISEADAYLVVSSEYNNTIPPALSNMLDHFPGSSFVFKPSAIVCYSTGKSLNR